MVHRHGCYERYAGPEGTLKERIQRYLCRPCGLSFSVLLPHRLPYRQIRAERLEAEAGRLRLDQGELSLTLRAMLHRRRKVANLLKL